MDSAAGAEPELFRFDTQLFPFLFVSFSDCSFSAGFLDFLTRRRGLYF